MTNYKVLAICGPTATGKTGLGVELAKLLGGELVSADSRQVFEEMDIVTGKDLPAGASPSVTDVKWRDRFLVTYDLDGIPVWLYGIVKPNELFNVAYWYECAQLAVADILSRGKLPILVGGTGLYLKSFSQDLGEIHIPANQGLREKLSLRDTDYLFNYLNRIDPARAVALNSSDVKNPRRLIRAIEKSLHVQSDDGNTLPARIKYDVFTVGLTAPKEYLFRLVDERIESRFNQGARQEALSLLEKYGTNLPSLTACGYRAFLDLNPARKWVTLEHQYIGQQLTWYRKHSCNVWSDISLPDWKSDIIVQVRNWYNEN